MKKIFIVSFLSISYTFAFAQVVVPPAPTQPPVKVVKPVVDDNIYEKTDVPAQYKKGQDEMYQELLNASDYPRLARRNKEDADIKIRFVVTKEGRAKDMKFVSSNNANKVLRDEAEKTVADFIKKYPTGWTPAVNKNKAVNSYLEVEFNFRTERKRP